MNIGKSIYNPLKIHIANSIEENVRFSLCNLLFHQLWEIPRNEIFELVDDSIWELSEGINNIIINENWLFNKNVNS
jgi:hypothetical protein